MASEGQERAQAASLTSLPRVEDLPSAADGYDREKVREALYKGTFKAPPGPITFDETGFPDNGAFTLQMQNGKVVIVWPPDLAIGKLAWPSPSWR